VYLQATHQLIFVVGPLAPLYLGTFCDSNILALSIMVVYLKAIHQLIFVVGPLAPLYLGAFCGSTILALSIMGGVFAGKSSADVVIHFPFKKLKKKKMLQ
jgi:hypothetical protein